MFGNIGSQPFGSTPSKEGSNTGGFKLGASSGSVFGASSGSAFGASSGSAFGASSGSAFGASSNTSTSTGTAAPAFNFSMNKTDAKPAATPAFSFGQKTDDKPAATAAPSFSFGQKTDDKPAAAPAFSFGNKTDDKPAAAPSLSFGQKTDDKPTANAAPAFSLGKKTDEKPAAPMFALAKPEEKKDDAAKASATTSGFSLGAKPATATASETAPATSGFSLGSKPAETDKEKKTVSFTASTAATDTKKELSKTLEPQPITLNNKTLEDLITKWTNQLTKASSSFQSYAEKTKEWDSVLVQGGEKINQLYTDVVTAEQAQAKVEQQLLYIERQQTELETFLDNYEVKAENLLSEVLSSTNQQRDSSVITNDQKRAQAYRTAELLDENLNSLGLNLSSLITEINEVSDSFNKANGLGKDDTTEENENSLNQIVKLLNTHLDSLKWIEKNSDDLKSELDRFKGLDL